MPPVASPSEAPSCLAVMRRALEPRTHRPIVYSVDFGSTQRQYPFGRETFTRREDAEQFIEELRRDERSLRVDCGSRSTSLRLAGTNSGRIGVSADEPRGRTLQHLI